VKTGKLLARALLAGAGLPILGVPATVRTHIRPHSPIAFPRLHASLNRMDCMYCHYSADRSQDAGMPPLKMCADCHIPAGVPTVRADKPEVKKLIAYWRAQKPIPCVRIYDLPDHVHFPHMRHVALGSSGVYCQECHGLVHSRTWASISADHEQLIQCHGRARTDCRLPLLAAAAPDRIPMSPTLRNK
jgi:hypothetical protein